MSKEDKIILFQERKIRRIWQDEQWFFSIIDVITVLTDSKDSRQYWKRLNQRDVQIKAGVQIVPVLFDTEGGKQKIICANTEGLYRIIMSVPSPKAEPFKLWLAQVGRERMEEIENPELGFERLKEVYRAKGYSNEWIERRMTSIDIRKQLTDEWQKRGVEEGQEYAILTAEIAKATFGLTPSQHKEHKGLARENLRDHMTNLELIFTALGEELTRDEAVKTDAQGFEENREMAKKGGRIAGNARKQVEKDTGRVVVSDKNFKNQISKTEENQELDKGDF